MQDAARGRRRRGTGGRRGRVLRVWLLWFAALNLVYLVLISAVIGAELVLGAIASALAATAGTALSEQRLLDFRSRLSWLAPAARLPLRAGRESGQVLAALAAQLSHPGRVRGRFRVVEVDLPDDEAGAATRAALIIVGESFAPGGYVVDIDRDRGLMLVHDLVDGGRS